MSRVKNHSVIPLYTAHISTVTLGARPSLLNENWRFIQGVARVAPWGVASDPDDPFWADLMM